MSGAILAALGLAALSALCIFGGYELGRVSEQATHPAADACASTQRMVILKLSPAAEALIDSQRGDRWQVLEARPVPRGKP